MFGKPSAILGAGVPPALVFLDWIAMKSDPVGWVRRNFRTVPTCGAGDG